MNMKEDKLKLIQDEEAKKKEKELLYLLAEVKNQAFNNPDPNSNIAVLAMYETMINFYKKVSWLS